MVRIVPDIRGSESVAMITAPVESVMGTALSCFLFLWVDSMAPTLKAWGGVISKITSLSLEVSSMVSPSLPARSLNFIEMGITPSESISVKI